MRTFRKTLEESLNQRQRKLLRSASTRDKTLKDIFDITIGTKPGHTYKVI